MTTNSNTDAVVDTTNAVAVAKPETLEMIEAAKSAWSSALESTDAFVVAASRATYAASTDGLIGKGQRYENSEQFGNLFPNRDGQGASKSTVTRWRRLGHCLDLGIEAGSEEWHYLVSKANNIGSALDKATSKTAVRKAVAAYKAKVKSGQGGNGKGTTDASTDEGGDEATTRGPESTTHVVPNGVSGMLDMLEQIAARLAGSPISPAEAARLAEVLATLESVQVADAETVAETRAA